MVIIIILLILVAAYFYFGASAKPVNGTYKGKIGGNSPAALEYTFKVTDSKINLGTKFGNKDYDVVRAKKDVDLNPVFMFTIKPGDKVLDTPAVKDEEIYFITKDKKFITYSCKKEKEECTYTKENEFALVEPSK